MKLDILGNELRTGDTVVRIFRNAFLEVTRIKSLATQRATFEYYGSSGYEMILSLSFFGYDAKSYLDPLEILTDGCGNIPDIGDDVIFPVDNQYRLGSVTSVGKVKATIISDGERFFREYPCLLDISKIGLSDTLGKAMKLKSKQSKVL